ncbi:hypothetical protein EBU24_05650, partial [bacterium]|nr:hypothetical protein [bacterium]
PYEPWRRHQSVMHMNGASIRVNLPPKDLLEQVLDVNGFNEFRRNTNFNTIFVQSLSPLTVRMIVDNSYEEYETYLKTIMHPGAIKETMSYMESKKEHLLQVLLVGCKEGLEELKRNGLDK